jgi:hypothetical protein
MTNHPSLLSKLLERDPEGVKAFMTTETAKPHTSFFDFSDEENYGHD